MDLIIENPGIDGRSISKGRHIAVSGRIISGAPVPDDARLVCTLEDESGNILRRTESRRKNDPNMILYSDDITGYPEELDPGREDMRRFGFAETVVSDISDPDASMRNAEIKCFYSDTAFKTFFVSATGTEQGLYLDDGIGFTDKDGKPYGILTEGDYLIRVTMKEQSGKLLASDSVKIRIEPAEKTVICRFDPPEHKENMKRWAKEEGFTLVSDTIPGYLEPYKGIWLYHMGLLRMYRASDVSLYAKGKVNAFVYLMDETSTSYSTELGWLMKTGALDDPERFTAYCYDIGEAVVGKGKSFERAGKIVELGKSETMRVCRIDTVNEKAEEGILDLDFSSVDDSSFGDFTVKAGSRFAITGVIRPFSPGSDKVTLRDDNTYDIGMKPESIVYRFITENSEKTEVKNAGMSRISGKPIGGSVYEFYNIFECSYNAGETVKVIISAKDGEENILPAKTEIIIKVV